MTRDFTLLPATAAAGLIAGPGAATFLAAALAAAAAAWLARRPPSVDVGFATLDPASPDPGLLADALRLAADRARSSGRAVSLRLAALPPLAPHPVRITLTRDGDACLETAREALPLKRPGAWIPDHPLPLTLSRARGLTLLLEPAGPARVRVSLAPAFAAPPQLWPLLALVAAGACALDIGWLLAAALGFAFHAYLLEHEASRAPQDAQVQRG
jgi:hypothetical protein